MRSPATIPRVWQHLLQAARVPEEGRATAAMTLEAPATSVRVADIAATIVGADMNAVETEAVNPSVMMLPVSQYPKTPVPQLEFLSGRLNGHTTVYNEDRTYLQLALATYPLPVNPSGCARTEQWQRKQTGPPRKTRRRGLGAAVPAPGGDAAAPRSTDAFVAVDGQVYKWHVEDHDTNCTEDERQRYIAAYAVRQAARAPASIPAAAAAGSTHTAGPAVPTLHIGRSFIHGFGLFTSSFIARGGYVAEYVGELVRGQVADLREEQRAARGITSNYMFRLDEDWIIDATTRGGRARYINHSCEPNCYAVRFDSFVCSSLLHFISLEFDLRTLAYVI
jgi:hypothetical protein